MASEDKLQVRAFHNLNDLQTCLADWEELLSVYPLATTFSTFEWLSSWWKSFGKDRQLLVLGFYEASKVVGLACSSIARRRLPAGLTLRVLTLMGDGSHDSDNLDLPVRPGYEEKFVQALLAYLEENRKFWDVCELNTLPPASPALRSVLTLLEERGWTAYRSERKASLIRLPDTWEAYLAQLSSEDQKNLVRYSRRLEKRYQVRMYRCAEESELPRVLEALFRLHQARWEAAGESGTFRSPERRHFYYELSRALLKRGWLELWVLELDGEIASAQYAFRFRDAVYQLQEGNDPAKSSDRIGFILRGQVMKQLIIEGVRVYDFLGGEPGYKARWGAEPAAYVDLHFALRFSFGAACLRIIHGSAAAKEWLRRNLPKSAWDKLHKINVGVRGGEPPTGSTGEIGSKETTSDLQAVRQNDSLPLEYGSFSMPRTRAKRS